MAPLDLLVRRLDAQCALEEADRLAILALPCAMRTLPAAAMLMREGETPGACVVLLSGFACRVKLTARGARQIVGLHIAGDPVDFQSLYLDTADHSVQALTSVDVALLPRDALHALIRHRPGVARAVLVNLSVDASILREWVTNVGRRDAGTRLAHLLCEMVMRLVAVGLAPDHRFELPMTQEQIGDALGLTPVHVNRTLRALEADGLIRRSRRLVASGDFRRLRAAAGFNPRYLHLERQTAGAAT